MEAIRFHKRVNKKGSVTISKLPPGKDVDVIVLLSDDDDFQKDMQLLMSKVSSRQKFKGMSKAEIIQKLRKDREEVWKQRHAD